MAVLAVVWLLIMDRHDDDEVLSAPEFSRADQAVSPLPTALPLDARKVALGRRLFHDVRLSHDDTLSCATCHPLDKAGVDGLPVAVGIGKQHGTLNTPTVLNSAFSFRQFWDGRAATLEEQVNGPVHNPIEMASNWGEVIVKLKQDPQYAVEFRALWRDGVTAAHIESAIAEFERSLITPDAPFDLYLKGNDQALSEPARRGWNLFRDLGCIACHQGVNLGGNMYSSLGVMGDFFAERARPVLESDLGRFNVSKRREDRHVFKVPSLRNVERTAPYFHDGSVATLADAVEVMARYQLGEKLTTRDRDDLVHFLTSLNGHLPVVSEGHR